MWYKNICSASFSFVTMHACDRRTDRQTDRQTDRITTPKTALTYARVVKIFIMLKLNVIGKLVSYIYHSRKNVQFFETRCIFYKYKEMKLADNTIKHTYSTQLEVVPANVSAYSFAFCSIIAISSSGL